MSDSSGQNGDLYTFGPGHGDFYKLLQDVEVPDSLNSWILQCLLLGLVERCRKLLSPGFSPKFSRVHNYQIAGHLKPGSSKKLGRWWMFMEANYRPGPAKCPPLDSRPSFILKSPFEPPAQNIIKSEEVTAVQHLIRWFWRLTLGWLAWPHKVLIKYNDSAARLRHWLGFKPQSAHAGNENGILLANKYSDSSYS